MDKHLCPVGIAWTLDNFVRRWVHNPKRIFGRYIKPGMKIIDFGCASGTFSIALAKMLNGNGKVIAVDIQGRLLDKLKEKIKNKPYEKLIKTHKSGKDRIGIKEKVDFILAFWSIHETNDEKKIFKELYSDFCYFMSSVLKQPAFA